MASLSLGRVLAVGVCLLALFSLPSAHAVDRSHRGAPVPPQQVKTDYNVVGDGKTPMEDIPQLIVQPKKGAENTTIVVHVASTPSPPPTPPSAQKSQLSDAATQQQQPQQVGGMLNLVPAATLGAPATQANTIPPALASFAAALAQSQGTAATNPQALAAFQLQQQAALAALSGVGAPSLFPSAYPGFSITPAATLIAPNPSAAAQGLAPVPLSVTTPAADLSAAAATTPYTSNPDPNGQIGTFAMQSVPGVRIVAEDGTETPDCGCAGAANCNNPCQMSKEQQIEAALDGVKTQIVQVAQKVQQENRWLKAVDDITKHYREKAHKVTAHVGKLKNVIQKLFSKKKHYEDLLLQAQLDEEKFKNVAQKQQWSQVTEPVIANQLPEAPCADQTTGCQAAQQSSAVAPAQLQSASS